MGSRRCFFPCTGKWTAFGEKYRKNGFSLCSDCVWKSKVLISVQINAKPKPDPKLNPKRKLKPSFYMKSKNSNPRPEPNFCPNQN